MKKLFSAFAVLTAFAMIAVSCNDDETKDDAEIAVTEVKVTPAAVSVVAGTTTTLKAEVLPENATNKAVKWTSRDEAVATVDQAGVVTAVAEGDVRIYVTCGKVNAYATVTVTAAPIRVEKITPLEDRTAPVRGCDRETDLHDRPCQRHRPDHGLDDEQ